LLGGIDEMLMQIIKLCTDYNITMVYALNRKKMGGILRKKVPVSIVGIFSYDGAEVSISTVWRFTMLRENSICLYFP